MARDSEILRSGLASVCLVSAALGGCQGADSSAVTDKSPQPKTAEPVVVQAAQPLPCILSVPRTNLGPILFPHIDGAKEFDGAIVSRLDADTVNSIITNNLGFEVERGARCSLVDNTVTYSKVQVTTGPHAGRVGWLPSTQIRGQ